MVIADFRPHAAQVVAALMASLQDTGDSPVSLTLVIGQTRVTLTVESAFTADAQGGAPLQLTADEVRLIAASRASGGRALGAKQSVQPSACVH